MLFTTLVGYLGADAECKKENGKEFTVFRIADTRKWKDASGTSHEETTWVDCIISGDPAVSKFLKKGQLVFVSGSQSLRVYSSKKDRCMKAGLTINVQRIELLGSKGDEIPNTLTNEDKSHNYTITKHYYCAELRRGVDQPESVMLFGKNEQTFVVDRDGWVYPNKKDEE